MRDDMVERVANAISAADADFQDVTSTPTERWYTTLARAAIEAMREPTNAMIVQGADGGGGEHITAWRAMIDEALVTPALPEAPKAE